MPSAANIKVDKQVPSETAIVDSASSQQTSPIKQAIVVIEHKIRNLEKRKGKLEAYRELQNSGKDLNQDQRIAVAKFDEVVQTLEFARDLCKQFHGIAAVAEKEAKKVARKEAANRSQAEIAKVREILLVQDALQQLGQEAVREDFLLGRNNAATLTEDDLKLLDDVYTEVSPKHEPGLPHNFTTQIQTAAEHLLAIVDGKPKDVFGSTYTHVKEVIGKIHESGYLDQPIPENHYTEESQEVLVETESKVETGQDLPLNESITVYHTETNIPRPQQQQQQPPEDHAILASTIHDSQQQQQPQQQQQQLQEQPPPQPPQQQQFFQQPRPISEVLGTGTFFFLQDSELDSPEQVPPNPVITNAAIPSQTFTNQNFVNLTDGVVQRQNPMGGFVSPNPPPPIPMPPSHIPGMEFAAVAATPLQGNPMTYTNYQQAASSVPEVIPPVQQPPQHQQQSQKQQTHVVQSSTVPSQPQQKHVPEPMTNIRNGDDATTKKPINESMNNSPKNAPKQQRPNTRKNGPGGGGSTNYQPQSYYQNFNGYMNNRPRGNRGGGAAGNTSGPKPGGGARAPPQHTTRQKQAQH